MMSRKMRDSVDDMHEAFRVFDCEGKGFIPAEDLRSVMNNLGECLTQGEIEEIMGEVDMDGDGMLDFQGKKRANPVHLPHYNAGHFFFDIQCIAFEYECVE